jgi:HEAT repeat protein
MTEEETLADPARRKRLAVLAGHRGDVQVARHYLTDSDASVRASAVAALARAGALAATEIEAALDDAAPLVRRRAAELAAAYASVDLLGVLDDPDDSVVEMAAWAVGEQPDGRAEAIERLSSLAASHRDALCREAAVAALGALGDGRGLAAILAALGDKPAVRRRAVIALAPFDGPDVDAALQRALEDRDWQVRQAAEDQLRSDD